MTALVTGATGFVGTRLVAKLRESGRRVRLLVRDRERAAAQLGGPGVELVVADLTRSDLDPSLCHGVSVVFHLAGHAHAEDEGSGRSNELHQSVTVEGTRRLLANASFHSVSRFIFLSSVKAIGEATTGTASAGDHPAPTTAYGRAKRAAELLVLEPRERPIGVVLRSPLVYGPEVKGNLRQMLSAVARRRFPPLPPVDNHRSMIDVRDLVEALLLLERDRRADGRVFIATDGEPYSTRRIYEAMCRATGTPVPQWSIPLRALELGARTGDALSTLLRRRIPLTTERLSKLFGSAHYSNQALVDLGFRPMHRLETALPEMVDAWRALGSDPR